MERNRLTDNSTKATKFHNTHCSNELTHCCDVSRSIQSSVCLGTQHPSLKTIRQHEQFCTDCRKRLVKNSNCRVPFPSPSQAPERSPHEATSFLPETTTAFRTVGFARSGGQEPRLKEPPSRAPEVRVRLGRAADCEGLASLTPAVRRVLAPDVRQTISPRRLNTHRLYTIAHPRLSDYETKCFHVGTSV